MMFHWFTLVLSYVAVLLLLCCLLPFSQIYSLLHTQDSLFDVVDSANNIRLASAKKYFQNLDENSSLQLYKDRLSQGGIMFAVGIITVKRTKETKQHESLGYLLQSTSFMDSMLKGNAFFNSSVPFICNVDVFPQAHFDAVNLYPFMPYTERFGSNSLGIADVKIPNSSNLFRDFMNHQSRYHKETFDYTFCLLTAASLNPQFILLIEDDAIPQRDFPTVLEHLINFRLNLTSHGSQNFGFLKLYFPFKWQGFGFELNKIVDLLSLSVIGASIGCVVFHLSSYRHASSHTKRSVFVYGFLVTLITCWMIGRQNIIELRRISRHLYRLQSSEGCCTQAMLYPLSVVKPLGQFLAHKHRNHHTDLTIIDFISHNSMPTLQVEPNLFYHIGLYTTLDMGQKNPEEFIFHW
ncbi:unnamed protein product [Lymnaea stagnalis]|uniref:Transmembrane protein n=1 Tax=Lymnaea stagnalis TaxID=6523 RepID=A0AAV2GXJ6_LYMST